MTYFHLDEDDVKMMMIIIIIIMIMIITQIMIIMMMKWRGKLCPHRIIDKQVNTYHSMPMCPMFSSITDANLINMELVSKCSSSKTISKYLGYITTNNKREVCSVSLREQHTRVHSVRGPSQRETTLPGYKQRHPSLSPPAHRMIPKHNKHLHHHIFAARYMIENVPWLIALSDLGHWAGSDSIY